MAKISRKKMTADPLLPSNRLWNAAECALYLNTTVTEVYNKVARQTLPAVHVGRSLRFDPIKIKKMKDENEVKTLEELTKEATK